MNEFYDPCLAHSGYSTNAYGIIRLKMKIKTKTRRKFKIKMVIR